MTTRHPHSGLAPLGVLHLAVAFALGAVCDLGVAVAATPGPAATITALQDAETRVAPSGKAHVRFLARGMRAFMGQLRMDPGAEVPQHQDASEEFIYILQGAGTMTIDGTTTAVKAGDAIYMPTDATVSFVNGERELVGLQVFAGPESAAKYDKWKVIGGKHR